MLRSCRAELLVLRKRYATWILGAAWVLLAVFFLYVTPYFLYKSPSGGGSAEGLAAMLPANLVGNLLVAFPFYGGILALILAVIATGTEYGQGTLKTVLTQRPARWKVFLGRLLALGFVLLFFVVAVFCAGAICSYVVAQRENAAVGWPAAWDVAVAACAGWFILVVWAALGAFLAVLLRGTAIAIGVGVLYALVTEGLISEFANRSGVLDAISKAFLRSNAYSLAASLGASVGSQRDGPGVYTGSLLSPDRSALVLAAYGACLMLVALLVFLRRDVA